MALRSEWREDGSSIGRQRGFLIVSGRRTDYYAVVEAEKSSGSKPEGGVVGEQMSGNGTHSGKPGKVNTGDFNEILLWGSLGVLSMVGCVLVLKRR